MAPLGAEPSATTRQWQPGGCKKPVLGWFHRYPARFHIDAIREAFAFACKRLDAPPSLVLDPFSGTGATLAFARQAGIPSYGIELTPLGVLIAQVRLWPPRDLDAALQMVEQLASVRVTRQVHRIAPDLVSWIGKANARSLAYLIEKAQEVADARLRRWLMLTISSSLRPCSVWLSGSIKPQIDPNRAPSPLGEHLVRAARQLKRDCENELRAHVRTVRATIVRGDARQVALPDEAVDAVITSPPYECMYDYFDVHRLTYLAFGWKQERERQIGCSAKIAPDGVAFTPPQLMESWYVKEFRREETIDGRALRHYFDGMNTHFAEMRRVVRKGGVLVYALADSMRRGKRFALVEAVAEQMKAADFGHIRIKYRESSNQRILPSRRDVSTGRFSSKGRAVEIEEALVSARA